MSRQQTPLARCPRKPIRNRDRWIRGTLFAALILGATSGITRAQVPTIELSAVSRLAGKAGTQFEMRSSAGSRLEEVQQLRFSHAGITATLLTDDPLPHTQQRLPRYGNFQVSIADDVPPGRYEVRAAGRHGISNPRVFLVHLLAGGDVSAAPSTDRNAPTPLKLDTVYQVKATAAQIHYFAVKVGAGQTVRIDCLAARIDSQAMPVLTLKDAKGQTSQVQSGSETVDPHLTIRDPGDYVLEIHDAIYRGGEEYGCLVIARIGDRPVDLGSPVTPAVGGQMPRMWLPAAASLPPKLTESIVEVEETSDANSLTPPCTVHARFDSREDEDVYLFSAQEGEQWVIDLVSHRLGEPTDCRMILERAEPQASGDPTWQQVFAQDDSQKISDGVLQLGSTDPVAIFTAPKSGNYRLTVRDLDSGQSLRDTQDYYLDLRRPEPGFQLVAYRPFPTKDPKSARPIGSQLFRGGTEAIRVHCLRIDGWAGPIDVSVEGLPEGVVCAPATIAANQSQTQLTLVAAENATHAVGDIRVIGRGKIGDQDHVTEAKPAAIQWGRGHLRDFIRCRLSSGLSVAVSDKDLLPISISVGDGKVSDVKKGTSLKLPVKLTRREGGKVNYVIRARDLPPKVTCGDVTIAADKDAAEVELKVAGDAATGTYSLWWQSETKLKIKPNAQALERATAYRAHLQKLSEDPSQADQLDAIKAAIKAADARVEAAKGSAKDQDLTLFLPSPHVTIRVVDP